MDLVNLLAIILSLSAALLNTCLSRCIHVILRWRPSGLLSNQSLSAGSAFSGCLCLLFGAKTPWKRVSLTRGSGAKAEGLAIRSGNKVQRFKEDMGGAVTVRGFQLVSNLSMGRYRQTLL